MGKIKLFVIPISVITVAALVYFFLYFNNQETGLPVGSPVSSASAEKQKYSNETYGFSFEYPEGFKITEISEEWGTTILIQKPGARESFQIAVSDFPGETESLTTVRVKKDLPNLVMEDPKEVIIGKEKGIRAIVFFGRDETVGKTLELWFHKNDYLFQVSTYPEFDRVIGPIFDSLKFNR